MTTQDPWVLVITRVMGRVGRDLERHQGKSYDMVRLDLPHVTQGGCIACDLTDDASLDLAFSEIAQNLGHHIASVIRLAVYSDFSGR